MLKESRVFIIILILGALCLVTLFMLGTVISWFEPEYEQGTIKVIRRSLERNSENQKYGKYPDPSFFDIRYEGDNTYDITLEIWEMGSLYHSIPMCQTDRENGFRRIVVYVIESDEGGSEVVLEVCSKIGSVQVRKDIRMTPGDITAERKGKYNAYDEEDTIYIWGMYEHDGDTIKNAHLKENVVLYDKVVVLVIEPIS